MEIGKLTGVHDVQAFTSVSPLSPEEKAQQRELIRAVEAVNSSHLFGATTELTFAYDRQSKKTILRIVDKETKEVVRQLPPEYLLRLAEGLEKE